MNRQSALGENMTLHTNMSIVISTTYRLMLLSRKLTRNAHGTGLMMQN